jgi:hypothetical protein
MYRAVTMARTLASVRERAIGKQFLHSGKQAILLDDIPSDDAAPRNILHLTETDSLALQFFDHRCRRLCRPSSGFDP